MYPRKQAKVKAYFFGYTVVSGTKFFNTL